MTWPSTSPYPFRTREVHSLRSLYDSLAAALPDVTVTDWWSCPPGLPRLWGCVLVQFTRWEPNARRALDELMAAELTEPAALAAADPGHLGVLIRSAGFYRQKAATLQTLAAFVVQQGGLDGLARLGALNPDALRRGLLAVRGVGPETADAILLYVFGLPTFIGDTYSRRLLGRLQGGPAPSYEAVRQAALAVGLDQHGLELFHALIVAHGQRYCTARAPRCQACPLALSCKASGEPGHAYA